MVKITGVRRHTRTLSRTQQASNVTQALFVGGQVIETAARLSITEGAVSGKNHVPSLPGEPPNADTHQLDTSISTRIVGRNRVEVYADAPHAVPLEYGTSKMAERPFMRPAAQRNRQKVADIVGRAVAIKVR